MPEEKENSGTLSAVILAGVLVVIGVFCVTYGLQTLVWMNTHRWATANPWLTDVPQALPVDPSAVPAPAPSMKASAAPSKNAPPKAAAKKDEPPKAYNYEFTAPWPGKFSVAPSAFGHVDFRFDSGQVIVFFDPELQIDTAHALKTSDAIEDQRFRGVFGQDYFDSNYAIYNAVYGVSPAQTSPFMSNSDAAQKSILLLWKLSFGFDTTPGVHSFQLGDMRGFEFGDAANGRPVAVRAFDARDKQFRYIFTTAAGTNGSFSQTDIDKAVATLRPVPLEDR